MAPALVRGPTRARTRIPDTAIGVGIKNRDIYVCSTYISILSKRVFLSARVGKTVAVTSSGAAFWIGTMSIVKSRKGNNIEWKRGRRREIKMVKLVAVLIQL